MYLPYVAVVCSVLIHSALPPRWSAFFLGTLGGLLYECSVFARRFSWTSSLGTLGDRSPSDSSSLLEDCGRDISSPGTLVNWFGVLKEEARVRSTVFVRRNVWCLSVAMHQGLRKYSLLKNKLQDAEGDDEESIIEVRSFYHR